MTEEWLEIPDPELKPRGSLKPCQVVAISNLGRWKRRSGEIEEIPMRSGRVHWYGSRIRCYRLLAEHFLVTVKRPDQDQVDHITHHPVDILPNDIRNLRWCTRKENSNFDECKMNQRRVKLGSNNPMYGRRMTYQQRLNCSRGKKKWWDSEEGQIERERRRKNANNR